MASDGGGVEADPTGQARLAHLEGHSRDHAYGGRDFWKLMISIVVCLALIENVFQMKIFNLISHLLLALNKV